MKFSTCNNHIPIYCSQFDGKTHITTFTTVIFAALFSDHGSFRFVNMKDPENGTACLVVQFGRQCTKTPAN